MPSGRRWSSGSRSVNIAAWSGSGGGRVPKAKPERPTPERWVEACYSNEPGSRASPSGSCVGAIDGGREGGGIYGRAVRPRTLLALALGSPAPAVCNPGPSARVLLPIAGREGRAAGGLDNVLPRLPNVLAATPGPMTGSQA
jgi:hypothetical protein